MSDLAVVSIVVLVCGTAILGPGLKFHWSAVVMLGKVAVSFVYFAWFFDGTWVLQDDMTYLREGRLLLGEGWNPLSIWTQEGRHALDAAVDGGQHVLYIWWNMLAQYTFGQHYFAPVMLNILLTCAAGAALHRLALLGGFSQAYAKYLLLFFVLHWDVVAWSSFQNRKDILILTLTLGMFAGVVGLRMAWGSARNMGGYALLLVACVLALGMSRFYVPLLAAGAVGMWLMLVVPVRAMLPAALAAGGAALLVFVYFFPQNLSDELRHLTLDPGQIAWGLARFPLTPRPWDIEIGYRFATLAAWLHWLMFAPMLYGMLRLWRESGVLRLLLLYAAVVVVFYAFVPFLQDDRHRLQIAFVIAWAQYHSVFLAARAAFPGKTACVRRAGA